MIMKIVFTSIVMRNIMDPHFLLLNYAFRIGGNKPLYG